MACREEKDEQVRTTEVFVNGIPEFGNDQVGSRTCVLE
jgi:hypothetical protein